MDPLLNFEALLEEVRRLRLENKELKDRMAMLDSSAFAALGRSPGSNDEESVERENVLVLDVDEVVDDDGLIVGMVIDNVEADSSLSKSSKRSKSRSGKRAKKSKTATVMNGRSYVRKAKKAEKKKAVSKISPAEAVQDRDVQRSQVSSLVPLRKRKKHLRLRVASDLGLLRELLRNDAVDSIGFEREVAVLFRRLEKRFPKKLHPVPESFEIVDVVRDLSLQKSSAFYVMDLSVVLRKYIEWTNVLPRIQPFYAVKANPDPVLVQALAFLGAGFDCASLVELELVVKSAGASPSSVIFANPSKAESHIIRAKELGVKMMTFDGKDEVTKILRIFPEAELVMRILPDDSRSMYGFGRKFGVRLEDIRDLVEFCGKTCPKNLVGVSFHVGTGCNDPGAFVDAILLARRTFDLAEEHGMEMTILDVGGGWPGYSGDGVPSMNDYGVSINPIIHQYFPSSVRIIAEPGRFFCTAAVILAVNVVSRRERAQEYLNKNYIAMEFGKTSEVRMDDLPSAKEALYYLSDGVYGSFNNVVFDHYVPQPKLLRRNRMEEEESSALHPSTLFGPTCDSVDIIAESVDLPWLDVGDWLYFSNMGAYTSASSTQFNGFQRPPMVYVAPKSASP